MKNEDQAKQLESYMKQDANHALKDFTKLSGEVMNIYHAEHSTKTAAKEEGRVYPSGPSCKNEYTNCWKFAQQCCGDKKISGMDLGTICCKACKKADATKKCKDKLHVDEKAAAGLKAIKYVGKNPEGRIISNSTCSDSQKAFAYKAVRSVTGNLKLALQKWDQKIFRKWFGHVSA